MRLGGVAQLGQLLELRARILVALPGSELLELGLERGRALERRVAVGRSRAERLELVLELLAVLGRLGQAALELRDPLGRLLLGPLELLAVRGGGLKLGLECTDALCDLGVDAGLVRLGGLVQPRLQLVEALRERVPLRQDGVELRLELLDPGAALGRRRGLGLLLGLGRQPRARARAQAPARAAEEPAAPLVRGLAVLELLRAPRDVAPASRRPEPSGAAGGGCGAGVAAGTGRVGCGASVRIGARPAISRRPALVPYSVRSRPPCCSASAFATAPGETKPRSTSTFPSGVPLRFCSARASRSWSSVRKPSSTMIWPSCRRVSGAASTNPLSAETWKA